MANHRRSAGFLKVFSVLMVAIGASLASAQPRPPAESLKVTSTPEREIVAPGDRIMVAVTLAFGRDYHAWPNEMPDPSTLPAIVRDLGVVPTIIEMRGSAPVRFSQGLWPPFDMLDGVPGYHHTITVFVPIKILEDAPLGELTIPLSVYTQICIGDLTSGGMCWPPNSFPAPVTITVQAEAPGESGPLPAVFEGLDREAVMATLERAASSGDAPGSGRTPTDPDAANGADGSAGVVVAGEGDTRARGTFFGLSLGTGFGLIILFGLIGGFVLNLTPCVLPVIPIKIMALSQHAGGSHSRTFFLGMMMSLGVVAFWAALAIPVLTLSGFADPSRMFGIWWLTAGIGVIIAVMSLGLMGMFQFNLPKSAYMFNPKADTAWGSFLFGVMTAVLGLPCFGFVAGALVPAATSLGPGIVIALFTSMGIGMGAPYLLLSAFPGLIEKVPRTGPASELVKQVMGLALLAAAAFFVGAGVKALVADAPYIAGQLHWWVTGGMLAIAGIWLIARTLKITKKPAYLLTSGVFALLLAGGGVLIAATFTLGARDDYRLKIEGQELATQRTADEIQSLVASIDARFSQLEDLASSPEASAVIEAARGDLVKLQSSATTGAIITSTWLPYTPEIVRRALDEGYVVALDFTADWCINCKALEAAVLNVGEARRQLRSDDVVMIKADLTATSAPGWKALAEFNQTGIPTLAIMSNGNEDNPWVRNAYDNADVVGAIEAARLVAQKPN